MHNGINQENEQVNQITRPQGEQTVDLNPLQETQNPTPNEMLNPVEDNIPQIPNKENEWVRNYCVYTLYFLNIKRTNI